MFTDRQIQKTIWKLNWPRIKRLVRSHHVHHRFLHQFAQFHTPMAIQMATAPRQTHSIAQQTIYQHRRHPKTLRHENNNNHSLQFPFKILTVYRWVHWIRNLKKKQVNNNRLPGFRCSFGELKIKYYPKHIRRRHVAWVCNVCHRPTKHFYRKKLT